jgi:hypothetical protein
MAEREEEGREREGREGDMDSKREGPDEDHTEVVFFSRYRSSSENIVSEKSFPPLLVLLFSTHNESSFADLSFFIFSNSSAVWLVT